MILGELHGVGHAHAGVPQHAHHVVLVVRPTLLQEGLAVGGHALHRAPVPALAELATLAIGDVVAELRRALHTHRLEDALLVDLAGQVELAGQQALPGGARALDERHLGLLAGLQHAEVEVGVGLGDEPIWGNAMVGQRSPPGSWMIRAGIPIDEPAAMPTGGELLRGAGATGR